MKKIIVALIGILCVINVNAQNVNEENDYPIKMTVEAGDKSKVEIRLVLNDDFKLFIPIDYMELFIYKQVLEAKYQCKYPRTFVPEMFVGVDIEDIIEIYYNNYTIPIIKYTCMVSGYAKNAYGVEDNVNIVIGVYENEFFIKNCSLLYTIRDYKYKSDNSVGIDFEYNGKKYFIDTFGKEPNDFIESLKTNLHNSK